MNLDPALFIGTVKTIVKEKVTDQSALCASHIGQRNIGKKSEKAKQAKKQ
jgi:hypothetical protein